MLELIQVLGLELIPVSVHQTAGDIVVNLALAAIIFHQAHGYLLSHRSLPFG